MADIEEIRRQTAEARQIVEEKKSQVAQLQSQLEEQEEAVPTTTSQKDLRDRFGGQQGLVQRRQIESIKSDIAQRKIDVSEYGKQLGEYEQQVAESEQNIASYDRAYKQFAEKKRESKLYSQELNKAVNDYNAGVPLDEAFKKFNVDYLVQKGILKFDEANQPEIRTESANKFNELLNKQPQLPFLSSRTENVKIQTRMPKTITNIGLVSAEEYNPKTGTPYGVVSSVEKPKDIIERAKSWLAERKIREQGNSILTGAGASLIGTASALAHPVQTINAIPTGIRSVASRVLTNKNFPELGQKIANPKPFDVGYIGAEIATLKAPSLAVKTSDLIRTAGLSELPASKVIAPEYFKGQTYPSIKKGQTAGQLLSEFKAKLPGETKPASWTASPTELSSNIIGKGSSELPGLYTAPDLSPHFFKVKSEKRNIFSMNFVPTLRPSAFRITPKNIELLKGIKYYQKNINPINKAKSAFSTATEKGKSYVPFVKTEKEAVIPFGTELTQKPTRYFFEFEGRRIPVYEYDTIYGKGKNIIKTTTAKDIASSYRPLKSIGYVNPLSSSVALGNVKTSYSISSSPAKSITILPSQSKTSSSKSSDFSKITGLSYPRSSPKPSAPNAPSSPRPSNYKSPNWFGSSGTSYKPSKSYGPPSYIPKTPPPYKPYIPKPYTAYSRKGGKVIKTGPNRYLVLVKRFGTDSIVGEAQTLEEAKRILANNLQTTLAASGYVAEKSTSRKVKVNDMFGGMFTPAKRDSYRVVQKRGKRLSSRSEVNEIWGFKKRKVKIGKRRISWW